jgi:hypothetical protein
MSAISEWWIHSWRGRERKRPTAEATSLPTTLGPNQPHPHLLHTAQPLLHGLDDAQERAAIVAAAFAQAVAHQAQRLDKVAGLSERRFHLPDKLMQLRRSAADPVVLQGMTASRRRTVMPRHGMPPESVMIISLVHAS